MGEWRRPGQWFEGKGVEKRSRLQQQLSVGPKMCIKMKGRRMELEDYEEGTLRSEKIY